VYSNGHSLQEYLAHPDELSLIANGLARPDEDSLFRKEVISLLTLATGLSFDAIQKKYPELETCRHFLNETAKELMDSGAAVQQEDRLMLTPHGIVTAHKIWERM
jgi:coproporphyrinogen III oxidase-like Fe-S oxidoreductase